MGQVVFEGVFLSFGAYKANGHVLHFFTDVFPVILRITSLFLIFRGRVLIQSHFLRESKNIRPLDLNRRQTVPKNGILRIFYDFLVVLGDFSHSHIVILMLSQF